MGEDYTFLTVFPVVSGDSIQPHDRKPVFRRSPTPEKTDQVEDPAEIRCHFIDGNCPKPEFIIERLQLGPAHQVQRSPGLPGQQGLQDRPRGPATAELRPDSDRGNLPRAVPVRFDLATANQFPFGSHSNQKALPGQSHRINLYLKNEVAYRLEFFFFRRSDQIIIQ